MDLILTLTFKACNDDQPECVVLYILVMGAASAFFLESSYVLISFMHIPSSLQSLKVSHWNLSLYFTRNNAAASN